MGHVICQGRGALVGGSADLRALRAGAVGMRGEWWVGLHGGHGRGKLAAV